MKTTRKTLVLIAVVALMLAALAVSTSAYVSWDAAKGAFPNQKQTTTKSLYKDINNSSWVQIAGGSAVDSGVIGDCSEEGDLYGTGGVSRYYYNATTKTVSLEAWQTGLGLTAGSNDKKSTTHVAYWLTQNAANIEHLQIRNVGSLQNVAYLFGALTSLKTITIEDTCTQWMGSKNDTGAFVGLTSLETVKWGTWNQSTGVFTPSYGEDGVVDLRGFKFLNPSTTIWSGSDAHMIMYAGSAVRASGAKKIILPYQQALKSDSDTYNIVVISDGSAEFKEGNPKQQETYGNAFPAGKHVFVIKDGDGNQYYTENNWDFNTGWSTVTVKAKEQAPYYGNYTGIIPYYFAYNCPNLEKVVVPEEVTLEYIEGAAFAQCTALKLIDIKGTVASDMAIENKNAFTGVSNLVINVYDADSKTNMENALTAAGVTATVKLISEGPEEPEEPVATMPEGVTNTSDLWLNTGYTDVDTEPGWYMIGINDTSYKVVDGKYPALAYLENGRFYWNKTTGEAVWLVPKLVTNISGNYGMELVYTVGTPNKTAQNSLEEGVHFTMGWIFNKLRSEGYAFESVEFRREEECTCTLYSSAGLVTKFSPKYFTPGSTANWHTYKGIVESELENGDDTTNGLYKYATIYSPIISDTNAAKITTLVVDYGITKMDKSAWENTTASKLTTIVYPEGISATSQILANNKFAHSVIYAPVSKHLLPAATQDSGFGNVIDLSGIKTMSLNNAFSNANAVENIILPATITSTSGAQAVFNGCSQLKRVWSGTTVPAVNTIDLTCASKLTSVCKSSFNTVPASTIILPATFQGVYYYSMELKEADACAKVFGVDKAHTIVLGANPTALTLAYASGKNGGLIAYYDKLQTLATDNDNRNNLDQIKVTCTVEEGTFTKTLAEWKTYFDEKAAEEAEPTILPFTAGLNVNGMETFLSDNQWGIFEIGVENVTKASTYSDIKSKGFDYVRVPVNFYTIYYEATSYGYTTEELMGYLDTGIEYALANDLYVMIDFHGWFYIGEEENDYEEFLYCWTQVANRYKDASEKVIFELLNEPWYTDGKAQAYLSDSRLNTMQAEAVEIIRNTGSNNATRLIVLCTADGNKAWKLDKLVLPDDDNLAVAIHEYSPYNFTHQNFEWAGLGGQTTTLEAQGGFASATGWDFSLIKAFKEANPKVPIILNEFGLNLVKATAADTETYLTGITSFCTENNIPWAYWKYYAGYSSDGAMGLYRQKYSLSSFAWDETALGHLFASASAS